MDDAYLRQLLVTGTIALIRYAKSKPDAVDPRFVALLARKPARLASIAIANKLRRIA
jgi:transposase